jgi:hypothetical protein
LFQKKFNDGVKHRNGSAGQNLMKTTEPIKLIWRFNMRDLEFLAPMTVMLGLFAMIAFIVYNNQQHKLRMKMVESGVTNLDLTKMKTPADNSLKYGMVSIALGLALFMGLIFEKYVHDLGGEITVALVPIFIGGALIASAMIDRNRAGKNAPPA